MAELRSGIAGFVLTIVVLSLFGASLLTTGILWWVGDWDHYGWGLGLTLKIVWGCWFVCLLGMVLTKVTIFGWHFRGYFGRDEQGVTGAAGRPDAPPLPPPPWRKSTKASFSSTLVLVSVSGSAVIASAVLWMLGDVLGDTTLWTVLGWIWAGWWVACIATVLIRVSLFGWEKKKVVRSLSGDNGASPASLTEGSKDKSPSP